jgi:hypothetical protein
MILGVRHQIRRLADLIEFIGVRGLRSLDARLAAYADNLERRRQERLERCLRQLPRLWLLVGGYRYSCPSEVIRKNYPDAREVRHDEFVTRWFVGFRPVAEVVPDAAGGYRVFFDEKELRVSASS